MKIGVKVLPRTEVLDTQGRAVERTLSRHEISVNQCRVGKYIELELNESSEEQAMSRAKEIAEFVLYNSLIETYTLELVER